MNKKLLFEEYLVKNKIISYEDMIKVLQYQRDHTPFFEDVALKLNLLSKKQICEIMCHQADSGLLPAEAARRKGFLTQAQSQQITKEVEAKKTPIEEVVAKLNNVSPEILDKMKKSYEEEIRQYIEIRDILRHINIFKTLDDKTLEALAYFATRERYTAGEKVIVEGEPAESFYCVVSGALRITKNNPKAEGKEVYITVIEANDVFGESSIFEKGVRTANVVTHFETVLLRFDKKPFFEFMKDYPKASLQIVLFIVQRLVNKISITNEELAFERKDFAAQADIDKWMKEFGGA